MPEETGLYQDIVSVCENKDTEEEVLSCITGAVQTLAFIESPDANDFITEPDEVEDTVILLDRKQRELRD